MTKRPYDVPDHALWDDIKKNVSPLRRHAGPRLPFPVLNGRPHPVAAVPRPSPFRSQAEHRNPPPLMQFDRRLAQRLLRGQLEPDARIDLHGDAMETARMKLYHFLQSQHHQGNRLVLVITGKGSSPFARHTLHGVTHSQSPEWQGRLRREIPDLLNEAQFRALVVGYQPAHPRHGGGGALYVKLRRA